MALAEAEIQQALLILGLAVRTDVVFYFYGDSERLRQAEIARKALVFVNATQEAKVREIIALYLTVEYDTDLVNYNGVSINPARLRVLLGRKMADTIGFEPPGMGDMSIRIERG